MDLARAILTLFKALDRTRGHSVRIESYSSNI